ncbi:Smr/MutS family protein [Marinimicrococcus flavescens]|uniref:Smr/MutS family protein n=1 Tax=Marinimicrococcus flavescens TaxID=3031815 RepID=A0AAP3UZR9_9PROT|nr:Smr/MutS family protein [Marinimicrococcus flavescens]
MRRGKREPTALELALWRHVVRDVHRLAGEEETLPPEPAAPAPPPAAPPPPPAAPLQPVPATVRPKPAPRPDPSNLDRRNWQRLQRGQYPLSARLDLHGMTQDAAYSALTSFLATQQQRGSRCVLVITGRGARSGGVLRSMTPRWLASPPNAARVLAHAPARVAHGGDGALYVLLRRLR